MSVSAIPTSTAVAMPTEEKPLQFRTKIAINEIPDHNQTPVSLDLTYANMMMNTKAISEILYPFFGDEKTELRELVCKFNSKFDDDMLLEVFRRSPNLILLDLEGCDSVSDAGISSLPGRITELDISGCPELTAFISRFPQLVSLKANRTHLSDKQIIEFAKHHPHLVDIELEGCPNITNKSLKTLAKLPKLKKISIVDSENTHPKTLSIAAKRGKFILYGNRRSVKTLTA
ncbi:MAG: hypothetical protein H7A37_03620 [Chlamydiales bacterium]|nr:hypothetical protein [Chlamydiales bacterium]